MRRSDATGAIYPVILSGGAGTRLWPLSRGMFPKQFIDLLGTGGGSLLAATLDRVVPAGGKAPAGAAARFAAPTVLCNADHRFLVRETLDARGIVPRAIILEPVARNTAPAIAVAALSVVREDPDGVIAVLPSDHTIADVAGFRDGLARAAGIARRQRRLVLFAISPDGPHTGYGYIRRGDPLAEADDGDACTAYAVSGFTEKPDRTTAEGYLASGEYAWNSGIFVLHAATLLDELERLAPDVLAAAGPALDGASEDLGFLRLAPEPFAAAPAVSIDVAVMEKTDRAAVIPVDVGWSDVGSWQALWQILPHDGAGNHVRGDAILEDTTGTLVDARHGLVATLGVDNLVIVDTPDALLVADKSRAQEVGRIVDRLRAAGRSEHIQHRRNLRPWGWFESLSEGPRFQVKKLVVKPGGTLSLQMHHHRSEHWVVVHGTARVTIGDEVRLVRENESVYITQTQWHRLENPGMVPLELIEVQIGSYLGEDDIIRSEDVYNRGPDETK